MLEIEGVQAGLPPEGRRRDQAIGDVEAGTQPVGQQQIVCRRKLGRLGGHNLISAQESLDPLQVLSGLTPGGFLWIHELCGGAPINSRNWSVFKLFLAQCLT